MTKENKMRLKTENCKLRIENCCKVLYAARRPLVFPIPNSPFSVFSFQFLFLCAAACNLAAAADPPAQPSTGDALRNSLNARSGDDYDRALLGEPGTADDNKKDHRASDLAKKLKQQLGPAANREDQSQHPLLLVAKGMCDVQTRLADGQSDAITQHVQRQVVADLQKIIDEAKKSGKCLGQNCTAGNRTSPGKAGSGQGARNESRPHPANDLPARDSNPNAANQQPRSEEEQLALQGIRGRHNIQLQPRRPDTKYELPGEHFLPEYEREIQDYFRRLSEGKAAEERP
jgi:hypothetical protein